MSKHSNEIAPSNLGRTARPVNGVQHRKCSPRWHKFQALFKGLHDTKLNEIIGYRLFTHTGKDKSEYDRDMEKLKRAWALPEKDDGKEDEALSRFQAMLY